MGSISNETTDMALQEELDQTRAERDTLDANYRSLLEKVTAMRNTLGNKLRLDAVSPIILHHANRGL